ncbi:hypothetical protein B0H67DRAFT_586399 [Lasiosphaeris hirsuta]|uniref:Uncharacterized protein n=1 Tax=Lasiosphaeris hirsuta TaxID=260670 RepID=A0AA40A9Z2_9PEZI|nr:hypothetical protein B0H67DRAFT_586399 [Lasiosphaeris hirsuta]
MLEIQMPSAPPSKISESPLFKELRESIALETIAFTFGCGGTIPIVSSLPDAAPEPTSSDPDKLRSTASLPIDLRWDPHDGSTPARQAKLTFPLEPTHEHNLDQLLQDMQPATFGLGGKDVYDESYRKALKLDPTRFSSTLNPYTLGIIDTISQALLPSLRHAKQTRAVKAELYKLNIYSGPSGQLGGYNVLDPRQLPLYQTIHKLMHDEEGWENGGWIGFNCAHVYPHTTKSPLNFVAPDNLKGADMLVYEIFSSLGLEIHFRPVVSDPQYTQYVEVDSEELDESGKPVKTNWEEREPPPLIGEYLGLTLWHGEIESQQTEMYATWSGEDPQQWTRQDKGDGPRPGFIDFGQVHWLNDFGHEEPQISWIAYGNQAEGLMTYSSLAMIVKVPAGGAKKAGQVIEDGIQPETVAEDQDS